MTQSSDQRFSPPPSNRETFKDLLVFEERLKQNAERLQRQRIKYEAFLVTIIVVSLLSAYKSFIAISSYKLFHYTHVGLLLVSITTLVLFFATGMYTDQIAYAYKFIPQANRALRPFNMFLITPSTVYPSKPRGMNTQKLSSTSTMIRNTLKRPFQAFFPNTSQEEAQQIHGGTVTNPTLKQLLTHSSDHPECPPDLNKHLDFFNLDDINPRGEILFSSVVDPHFIDQYKLYRNQWEIRQRKLNL